MVKKQQVLLWKEMEREEQVYCVHSKTHPDDRDRQPRKTQGYTSLQGDSLSLFEVNALIPRSQLWTLSSNMQQLQEVRSLETNVSYKNIKFNPGSDYRHTWSYQFRKISMEIKFYFEWVSEAF